MKIVVFFFIYFKWCDNKRGGGGGGGGGGGIYIVPYKVVDLGQNGILVNNHYEMVVIATIL